jgi:hypothetical protein
MLFVFNLIFNGFRFLAVEIVFPIEFSFGLSSPRKPLPKPIFAPNGQEGTCGNTDDAAAS